MHERHVIKFPARKFIFVLQSRNENWQRHQCLACRWNVLQQYPWQRQKSGHWEGKKSHPFRYVEKITFCISTCVQIYHKEKQIKLMPLSQQEGHRRILNTCRYVLCYRHRHDLKFIMRQFRIMTFEPNERNRSRLTQFTFKHSTVCSCCKQQKPFRYINHAARLFCPQPCLFYVSFHQTNQ